MPRSPKTTTTRARDTRPPIALPRDARQALERVPRAMTAWERLSYTHRREHVEAITEAKKPETRARRIAKLVERLDADTPLRHPTNSTRPLIARMAIGDGDRILVLEGDREAMALFAALPGGATIATAVGRGGFDAVVLFAADAAVLARRLPAALGACRIGGSLWVAYPKQASGRATTLTRDTGWAPTERADLKRVGMIALDDAWAAFRFRRTA